MQIAYNKSVLDGEEITVQAVCMLLIIHSACDFAALLLFWGGLGFKTYTIECVEMPAALMETVIPRSWCL